MLDFFDALTKSLGANWVALTALFFAMGVSKVYVYYKCFGFSIVGFFSMEELVSLLADNLIAFGVVLIGAFITMHYGVIQSSGPIEDGLFRYLWHNGILITIVLLCWLISTAYFLFRKRVHLYEWVVMLILSMVLFAIVPYSLRQEYRSVGSIYSVESLFLANVAIAVISITCVLTFTEYYKVMRLGHNSKVVLTVKGKEVACNSDLLFVGKLQNYVILHSKSKKQAIVIPVSEISEFRFPA